jgi:site-specific DNA-cytosine methylase
MGSARTKKGGGGGKPGRKTQKQLQNIKNGKCGGRGKNAVDMGAHPPPRLVINLFHGYGAVAMAAEMVGAEILLCVDNEDDCVRAGELNLGRTKEERARAHTVPSCDGSARVEMFPHAGGGDGGVSAGGDGGAAAVAVKYDLSSASPADMARDLAVLVHARLEKLGYPLDAVATVAGEAYQRRAVDARFDILFQASPPCQSISPACAKDKRRPEVGKEWMRGAVRLEKELARLVPISGAWYEQTAGADEVGEWLLTGVLEEAEFTGVIATKRIYAKEFGVCQRRPRILWFSADYRRGTSAEDVVNRLNLYMGKVINMETVYGLPQGCEVMSSGSAATLRDASKPAMHTVTTNQPSIVRPRGGAKKMNLGEVMLGQGEQNLHCFTPNLHN